MEPVVVDTDVASYVFKDDSRGAAFLPLISGRLRIASFMTVAELDLWARTARWGDRRRKDLAVYLRGFIVAPYDPDLCRVWAEASHSARLAGRPIQTADAWIAATALAHDLPLVTNNPGDYAGVEGLQVLTAGP